MENNKVILYGAGNFGKTFYKFMQLNGIADNIYAFCDSNHLSIKNIDGIPVIGYEEAIKMELPFIVSVSRANEQAYNEIVKKLRLNKCEIYYDVLSWMVGYTDIPKNILERSYCGFFHVDNMNQYFSDAEDKEPIAVFWDNDSPFFQMFNKLDLENVIELAVGRGRHVKQYIDLAGHVTLVDIDKENIDYCKNRYINYENKIDYYVNNGYDLCDLADDSYTSIFTYDAMVHFELLDVNNYLREAHRVLKKGAYALFHHSNNDKDYKASFSTGISGRSYMNKNTFCYLADRAGFEIVEQKVIPWVVDDLDCITLCKNK